MPPRALRACANDVIRMAEKPLFRDIEGDADEHETSEIESLCMKCGENVRGGGGGCVGVARGLTRGVFREFLEFF